MTRMGREARQERWLVQSLVYQWAFHLGTLEDLVLLATHKLNVLPGGFRYCFVWEYRLDAANLFLSKLTDQRGHLGPLKTARKVPPEW